MKYSPIISKASIYAALNSLPKVKLANVPTPLEDMNRLQYFLSKKFSNTPRILIKREDTTGLAMGGNKARHLEYIMGKVLKQGYDTVINVNHYHSNRARFVAASCAKFGLKCELISTDNLTSPLTGNLLLAKLMGAKIHRVPYEYADKTVNKVLAELCQQGRNPYVLSADKFAEWIGSVAFLNVGMEIESQLLDKGISGDVTIWGLYGYSLTGLILYARMRNLSWNGVAVAYYPTDQNALDTLLSSTNSAAKSLKLPIYLNSGDIELLKGYQGKDYGTPPYHEVFEAIDTLAKTESIILDPIYTGRSMAGLLGEISKGRFSKNSTVVFIHSGGTPQVFAFDKNIWEWQGGSTRIYRQQKYT